MTRPRDLVSVARALVWAGIAAGLALGAVAWGAW